MRNAIRPCCQLLSFAAALMGQPVIHTIAGGGVPENVPAAQTALWGPWGVVVNSSGAIFIADGQGDNRIRKIANGFINTIAGANTAAYGGDNGPAIAANLSQPSALAIDGSGNLYVADTGNYRIRKISTSGIISTIAGNGQSGFSGDGGPAISAMLTYPVGVAVDNAGNVYIADNNRIRKVSAAGTIATIAGTGVGGFSGDGGPASNAQLNFSGSQLAVDQSGNVYIADQSNQRIRKISLSGQITTVAGNGVAGYNGDGILATEAELGSPSGVAIDSNGNLLIADSGNERIRRVNSINQIISTIAGTGKQSFTPTGDGGPAIDATFNWPRNISAPIDGSVLITDAQNFDLRRIAPDGTISTIAGNDQIPFGGDDGPATQAILLFPLGLTVDTSGDLFVANYGNRRVRRVDGVTGVISTYAGTGIAADSGDGGPANAASIAEPWSVGADPFGNLFIGEVYDPYEVNGALRGINVGNGDIASLTLPPPPGAPADVYPPAIFSLATDDGGDLFFPDGVADTIGKIDAETGAVTIVAGVSSWLGQPGVPLGSLGDGGPAVQAYIGAVRWLAVDGAGNIFVAPLFVVEGFVRGNTIRRVDGETGIITTIAGNGQLGFSGDGGPAIEASLNTPADLNTDAAGNLYFCDTGNNRVRRIDVVTGIITTVAGSGSAVLSGDGGPATEAGGNFCNGLAITPSGALVLSDQNNNRIRQVDLAAPSEAGRPSFSAAGLVNAASNQSGEAPLSSGGFFTIYGQNLAPNTPSSGSDWSSSFSGVNAPTSLDGVRVLVNAKPAFLSFVQNGQINAIAPDDTRTGPAVVRVVNSAGISNPIVVQRGSVSPGLFTVMRNGVTYAATSSASYQAGDVVTLWGEGFGATNPPIPAGQIPSSAAPLANQPTVTIGGLVASVQFAGLTSVGLYQFNVVLPTVSAGDQSVLIQVNGVSTQSGVMLHVN